MPYRAETDVALDAFTRSLEERDMSNFAADEHRNNLKLLRNAKEQDLQEKEQQKLKLQAELAAHKSLVVTEHDNRQRQKHDKLAELEAKYLQAKLEVESLDTELAKAAYTKAKSAEEELHHKILQCDKEIIQKELEKLTANRSLTVHDELDHVWEALSAPGASKVKVQRTGGTPPRDDQLSNTLLPSVNGQAVSDQLSQTILGSGNVQNDGFHSRHGITPLDDNVIEGEIAMGDAASTGTNLIDNLMRTNSRTIVNAGTNSAAATSTSSCSSSTGMLNRGPQFFQARPVISPGSDAQSPFVSGSDVTSRFVPQASSSIGSKKPLGLAASRSATTSRFVAPAVLKMQYLDFDAHFPSPLLLPEKIYYHYDPEKHTTHCLSCMNCTAVFQSVKSWWHLHVTFCWYDLNLIALIKSQQPLPTLIHYPTLKLVPISWKGRVLHGLAESCCPSRMAKTVLTHDS
ncbi:unnamed protein product [Amoebophrya sp. A120]|nr:unnamed protein product [Amoebophrya sp. A120]|eukprot:GSA120T00025844001.1